MRLSVSSKRIVCPWRKYEWVINRWMLYYILIQKYTKIYKYTKYNWCHKNQHETLISSNCFCVEKYWFLHCRKTSFFCLEISSCIFGVIVLQIVIFNAFVGVSVIFCIYEHILKMCFVHLFKNVQKCEQFSYEIVL